MNGNSRQSTTSCEQCRTDIDEYAFVCTYCEQPHCQDHRLPESHDCPRLADARPPTSGGDEPDAFANSSRGATAGVETDLGNLRDRAAREREAEPYSVVEVEHTVGTKPDPDFASSPDVAPDGSVKTGKVTIDTATETRDTISVSQKAVIAGLVLLVLIVIGLLL
jgi:hypothetical protein